MLHIFFFSFSPPKAVYWTNLWTACSIGLEVYVTTLNQRALLIMSLSTFWKVSREIRSFWEPDGHSLTLQPPGTSVTSGNRRWAIRVVMPWYETAWMSQHLIAYLISSMRWVSEWITSLWPKGIFSAKGPSRWSWANCPECLCQATRTTLNLCLYPT